MVTRRIESFSNFFAALTVVAHFATICLIELPTALPKCLKVYYPEALFAPIQFYLEKTNDCLTASPPMWIKVSATFATLAALPLLAVLPDVVKGFRGRTNLRCPLLLIASCLSFADAQIWLHYMGTEKLCSGGEASSQQLAIDIRPALIYHGARGFAWLAFTLRLLLQDTFSGFSGSGGSGGGSRKNQRPSTTPTTSLGSAAVATVTTRSRAAAASAAPATAAPKKKKN